MGDKKENGRVIKWFVVPTMLISFIMAFVIPDFRTVGILYFVMTLFSLGIFSQKRFEHELYGIKSGFVAPLLVGAGTGIGFLVLSWVSPFFSLLTPVIPLSVSSDIRWFVIVWIAPIAEESFRSATIGLLKDVYKMKFFGVNIVQALVFSALHLLVYGVGLGSLAYWNQVYGQFLAVFGALFSAFLFGSLSGYMMKKFNNITPSIISHMIINFWLVSRGLIVVS